jgi:2OG-Fe(II) oxygenase superfamily
MHTAAIAEALTNTSTTSKFSGKYYAEQTLKNTALTITVDGVGAITFPINKDTIQNFRRVSKPAQYGLRKKTLTDVTVRNTYEIAADKVHVACEGKHFNAMMDKIRKALGLSNQTKLIPHLHNMLVYEAGQFFKPHQDTEKLDDMVATLVVVLPCPHIGGDLLIRHNKDKHRFVSENLDADSIKCVAFYSDCQHEIEKIKEGTRIVLTYNLVLEGDETLNIASTNSVLQDALKHYFDIPSQTERSEPLKLAYLLEHSYTEHSLSWNRLKGADRQHALELASAAEACGLTPHLALAEIHESWSTEGDEDGADDAEPSDLIDSGITLSTWFDKDNRRLPYTACSISEDEICSNVEYADSDPDEEEYEGYMGNYGNTVDYWYRRAAIVLWSKSDQVAMQFQFDYPSAVQALVKLTQKPNNHQAVLDTIRSSGDLLYQYRNRSRPGDKNEKRPADYLGSFARIAAYVDHKGVAQNVLRYFSVNELAANNVKSFVLLQERYGADWCLGLFNAAKEKAKTDYSFGPSLRPAKETEALVHAAIKAELDAELLNYIVDEAVDAHIKDDTGDRQIKPEELKRSLPERMKNARALLRAAFALMDAAAGQKLINYIIVTPSHYPLTTCAEWLIDILESDVPKAHTLSVKTLRDHVMKIMDRELSKGAKAANDWSIDSRLPCDCHQCRPVNAFLQAPNEYNKTLAIVQQHRNHIIDNFRGQLLPVKISVITKGSPHKLVLDKLPDLQKEANDQLNDLKVLRKRLT